MPREEKWAKGDFIVVFIAALLGSAADFVLGNRNNSLTGQKSKFAEDLAKLHKHEAGAPIDYQGDNYTGGSHRIKSRGHDVLRFIDGIKMFKEGQFIGVDGELIPFNQNGNDYAQLNLILAAGRYVKHMAADLCSSYSLPIPGYSFIMEGGNSQQMRNLKAQTIHMYRQGLLMDLN
ncbi:MAG: hypothetical protein MJ161_07040 [Clostridia bacterium]|nr:hypothetical protein [Clostridia bacterium]